MKFNDDKKNSILLCLLEKINQKDESVSKKVSDTFNINQNTVHTYINQLVKDGIIQRVKRGAYELIKNNHIYMLKRDNGDLDSDTYAFDRYFKQHIKQLPPNVYSMWEYTFSEMMNNVMDHSNAEEVILLVSQDYLNTSVMIIDNGVGIFEKIKDHFKLDTLDDAICELFKGKLTTDSANHSGEGIFFSSKIVDRFLILSSGKVFTNNKFNDSMIVNIEDKNTFDTGTLVFMELSNFSQKRTAEVFDLYSNDDGGFDKTRIPLKNAFDSSPVSRSQAKRVCNRLDKFKEVILDFDGLEWVGQGFAHQIFVVFQTEHPDISIVPINMNEDITKMYNHVRKG